jgi:DNA polymerase-3 subunit epsilon
MHPFIFVDVETTGLDPTRHAIIEIAVIRRDKDGSESIYHSRIKPTEEELEAASPTALAINGYRRAPEQWDDAPGIVDVMGELARFLQGSAYGTWVGHNVAFDVRFVEEAVESSLAIKPREWERPRRRLDTVQLAVEHLAPMGLQRFGLDSIRRWLGWGGKGAHTALVDVAQTRQLFDLLWRLGPLRWCALRFARFWNRVVKRTALPRSPLRPGEL